MALVYTLQRDFIVRKPIAAVFKFFSRAGNLEEITPPWLHFRILTPKPIHLRQGATLAYRLRIRGFPVHWLTEIESWNPPFEFVDVQMRGPYQQWRHTHRFAETGGGTRIEDIVNYALPFGPLGRIVNKLQVADDLSAIFDYREQRVRALLG
jgi:ligand-binding SRPBCC domain-containing protein